MLRVAVRRVQPDKVDQLRGWFAELGGPRASEAIETLRREGVSHEQAVLLDGSDGPILVWVTEADDIENALRAYDQSSHPLDDEHRAVMSEVLAGPIPVEMVLDLRAD